MDLIYKHEIKIIIIKMDKTNQKVYSTPYQMPLLTSLKFDDGLELKVLAGKNGEQWFDLRFYDEKGNPTRRGVRVRKAVISSIINVYEELDEPGVLMALNEMENKKKEVKEKLKDNGFLGKKVKKETVKIDEADNSSETPSDIVYTKKK